MINEYEASCARFPNDIYIYVFSILTKDDIRWFGVVRQVMPDKSIIETPDPEEPLCFKCGTAADAFPDDDPPHGVIVSVLSNRLFSGQFYSVRDTVDPDEEVERFRPRKVSRVMQVGQDFTFPVEYAAVKDMEDKYSQSTSGARVKTCTAYDALGQAYEAVSFQPGTAPLDVATTRGNIFVRLFNGFTEQNLSPSGQLRNDHAQCVFDRSVRSCDRDRGSLGANVFQLPSFETIATKMTQTAAARETKAKELTNEMNALSNGQASAVHIERVSGRRQLAPILDESTAESAATRGAARNAGGQPRAHAQPRHSVSPAAANHIRGGRARGGGVGRGNVGRSSAAKAAPDAFLGRSSAKASKPGRGTSPSTPSTPLKRKMVPGDYYKHKEMNYRDILRGALATRQTNPAPHRRLASSFTATPHY
jgi:hypothetical protein